MQNDDKTGTTTVKRDEKTKTTKTSRLCQVVKTAKNKTSLEIKELKL